MIIDDIKKIVTPIFRRVLLMVSRGTVKKSDEEVLQVELLKDEIRDKIKNVQQYGFASVPKKDAEAVVVFIGGNRDHGVVIATDDKRYRIDNMENGEVAIYTDEGDYVYLKRGHEIEVNCDGAKTTITKNQIEFSQNMTIKGQNITVDCTKFDVNGNLEVLK